MTTADDQKDISMFNHEWDTWISQMSDAALSEVSRIVHQEIKDRERAEPFDPDTDNFLKRCGKVGRELRDFHEEFNNEEF